MLAAALAAGLLSGVAGAQQAPVTTLDQGWTPADRATFYYTYQGSQMMPYAWFSALERPDSQVRFLFDNLARFGYLPPEQSPLNPQSLPVGFTTAMGRDGVEYAGMSCAACHTGQIEGKGWKIRLDGAPTTADFGAFLTEMTKAITQTMDDPAKFARFAAQVARIDKSQSDPAALKVKFTAWGQLWVRFMTQSIPTKDGIWGPARLDAFGMIFNRAAGKDLNVWENVVPATAPVSYPFLWNAHQQSAVQWNLSAPGGTDLNSLVRNVGEVIGVFADLDYCRGGKDAYGMACDLSWLKKEASLIDNNFIFHTTSVSLSGLLTLEDKIAKLAPPPWPAELGTPDPAKVAAGRKLFQENCAACHNMSAENNQPGKIWKVTAVDVGTDPLMYRSAYCRDVNTGMLEGAHILGPIGPRFKATMAGTDFLAKAAVVGALVSGYADPNPPGSPKIDAKPLLGQEVEWLFGLGEAEFWAWVEKKVDELAGKADPSSPAQKQDRTAACQNPQSIQATYESRPLYGIWATAPYLHNGSVRNLWELLKPSARPASFRVVPRSFDPKTVGIANATGDAGWLFDTSLPGNSNLGHTGEGMTTPMGGGIFRDEDLWALVEFMKVLNTPADLFPQKP